MKRGDVVTIALTGDFGKPRPAVIVQSDHFAEHPTIAILPVTSDLRNVSLVRIPIDPSPTNGLRKPSNIMIDRIQIVYREKIGNVIGHIDDEIMFAINRALVVFLGIV